MPISIRDDVVYIMLKKIHDGDRQPGLDEINFSETDFTGLELTPVDILGHLDYLNQEQYIHAEFSGNAYANQDDVPSAVNAKEFDFRIANTFGAADGPLPHLITFQKAELTEKGEAMLKEMDLNPPKALEHGKSVPIPDQHMPFLEKVMVKGGFPDLYDTRDFTEVVFRIMRDLMTTEAADRVADELHEEVLPTDEKALQMEITDLWKDTNPIVGFLSRVRPPLRTGTGAFEIDSDRFLFRVANEGGLAPTVDREQAAQAVFAATKAELSQERIQEIAQWMPAGPVRQLWDQA
jgi:uncharacterized protein (DUF2267 family)